MRSTVIDRRSLLVGAGAALTAAVTRSGSARSAQMFAALDAEDPLFAGARREADGTHSVVVTGVDGLPRVKIALPDRGHDIAVCEKSGRCLVFARRPGTFAVLFDPHGKTPPHTIASVPGRHFYGHGVFSPDGQLVFATENDYETTRGVIGVYDVSGETPARVGELWSGGIGPHDILPMPGGKTLVVANGGIETHPDRDREKLNIDTMQPNITFLDLDSGAVIGRLEAPAHLHKLSLRHMAVGENGRVWIGAQHQGGLDETPPLLASLDLGKGRLEFHDLPDELSGKLENYIGSVALSRDGEVVAASCPKVGRLLYFSARDGSFMGSQQRPDACGLAALDANGFLISDGNGGLSDSADVAGRPVPLASSPGVSWDNHMVAVDPLRFGA
ncbi:DUF1513 domain-containing protein [Stappia sp.]|uniref:DUF1513 domain-containing protein n=1 Tax=Stappia sp. TaxID=1870903 RepID=UPI0025EA5953|nr:DUF1513 domain-containing protein [Stappia sp.]